MRPVWHGAIWFAIGLVGWMTSSIFWALQSASGQGGVPTFEVVAAVFFAVMVAAFPVALVWGYLIKKRAGAAPAVPIAKIGHYPPATWVRCTICGKPVEWPTPACPRCGDRLQVYR